MHGVNSPRAVWLLGSKDNVVDKSVSWDEPFPNFSEPDIIIVNLKSLNMDVLKRIEEKNVDKLKIARDELFDYGSSSGT
jgi:hypothetical protein